MAMNAPEDFEHDPLREAKFNKLFDYLFILISRRWKYFVSYLAVNGLLFNAADKIPDAEGYFVVLSLAAIVMGAVFLRLISRVRARLAAIVKAINSLSAPDTFFEQDVGTNWSGVTVWLYIAIMCMTLPWFYLLFRRGFVPSIEVVVGVIAGLAFVINASTLNWRLNR